jgi:gliding motility-associated-like protein
VVWEDGSVGPNFHAPGPGIYTAIVSNVCGISTASTQVSIAPEFPYPQDAMVCPGDRMLVSLSGHTASILWSNGSQEENIELGEGEYSFQAIDPFGCARSGSFEILVDPGADGLSFIPNVFTPNGDGVNEKFTVVGAERADFKMEIFNRWGELIHSSTDVFDGWDGRYGGRDVPDGTYIYVVQYRSVCGDKGFKLQKGHVTVLRGLGGGPGNCWTGR